MALQDETAKDQETEINLGDWVVSEVLVREYTQAVGDSLPLYFNSESAPPLALSAWALGRLLDHLNLAPGAIHSLQEMEAARVVRFGERVRASVQLSKPRRRGGLEFITAALAIFSQPGKQGHTQGYTGEVRNPETHNPEPVLTGKTTVLTPSPPAAGSTRPEASATAGDNRGGGVEPGTGALPVVERTINQKQLDAYAKASGDFNPLHLDAEFAASTQFGGIIAHGMLTLAFISESMAAAFGEDWLASGGLRARFKGAAHLGDRLATSCRITEQAPEMKGGLTKCSVAVVSRDTGRELVSGNASVQVTTAAS